MEGMRWTGWLAATLVFAGGVVTAQDFRVETDVFAAAEKEPVAEFLTIFYGSYIYDFLLSEPKEITVFDMARQRFILLDVGRKVKTEVTTAEIEAFNQQLRERSVARDGAFFQPQLSYTFDETSQRHVLSSEKLVYRAKGVTPKFPAAVERYRAFADWYAQLSAVRPGNLPPYGRLELNKILAQSGQIPEEIERSVTVATVFPSRQVTARTHHLANWILSEQDQRRIREAGDQIATFSPVTLAEYLRGEQVAAGK